MTDAEKLALLILAARRAIGWLGSDDIERKEIRDLLRDVMIEIGEG